VGNGTARGSQSDAMKTQQLTAILLSALSACSSSSDRPNGALPGGGLSATVSCADGNNMRLHLARLRWSPEVESIAIYAMPTGAAGGLAPGSPQRPVLRFSGGAPCTGACEAEREAVAQSFLSGAAGQGWVYSDDLFPDMYQPSAFAFAVVRRGGTSQLVASLDGLRAHLAGLDTPDEAQAWAALHRLAATCRSARPNARAGQAWHELTTEFERCEQRPSGAVMARIQVLRRVHRDGRIESGAEQEVSSTPTQGCAVPGRMPLAGLELQTHDGSFGALLAQLAQAEAVSVVAFRELAGALTAANAPAALIARAERAAEDEVRHAALMSAHARRYGAVATTPSARERRYPSLLALALHNAEEGCVNETYAALVTLHQARFAEDLELRLDLHSIAQDELEHASWSHDLDAWLHMHLTAAEQLAVAGAKDRALKRLASCAAAPSNAVSLRAGLPEPEVATQLLAGLQTLLREAGPLPSAAH
jgi:hypothetical protein